MGAPKKADWREERHWKQQDIAKALGVSEGAISQWLKRGREGGLEALKEWSEQRWPAIKKSRRGPGHDQRGAMKPGFIRISMAVNTWAPRGQTPILRVKLTRDHLAAISGITADGRLFMQVRPASYDAAAVAGFLRVLLRKMRGPDRGDLGRVADPSGTRDQRLSAAKEPPNACVSNNFRAMPQISTRMRASGITSSAWSWAMSVVPIPISCIESSFKRKNACGTKRRSSKAALESRGYSV